MQTPRENSRSRSKLTARIQNPRGLMHDVGIQPRLLLQNEPLIVRIIGAPNESPSITLQTNHTTRELQKRSSDGKPSNDEAIEAHPVYQFAVQWVSRFLLLVPFTAEDGSPWSPPIHESACGRWPRYSRCQSCFELKLVMEVLCERLSHWYFLIFKN